jgi:hypothetical protein
MLQGALQGLGAMMLGCGHDQRNIVAQRVSVDSPPAGDSLPQSLSEIGPLGPVDLNQIRLPLGFTSRVVARAGQVVVEGSPYLWHYAPDGGATYATKDGGWIYVSNCELLDVGGVGALRFDAEGTIVDAYPIATGTNRNCGGGHTPQGTWLTCEEVARGRVIECDPFGKRDAVVRPALGIFNHEASAHDLDHQHVYLTEDEFDGAFYRFVPDRLDERGYADLSSGRLEVAEVRPNGEVVWHEVPDPTFEGTLATRYQVGPRARFSGGEGVWWHRGHIYFSTKGDDRIWDYDVEAARIRVLYDAWTASNPILTGVDCILGTAAGELLIAEDGGDMQVNVILSNGSLKPLLQIIGHVGSEVTGLAFDPSGTRMYFSSQRGGGNGITYEVTGPFHRREG